MSSAQEETPCLLAITQHLKNVLKGEMALLLLTKSIPLMTLERAPLIVLEEQETVLHTSSHCGGNALGKGLRGRVNCIKVNSLRIFSIPLLYIMEMTCGDPQCLVKQLEVICY